MGSRACRPYPEATNDSFAVRRDRPLLSMTWDGCALEGMPVSNFAAIALAIVAPQPPVAGGAATLWSRVSSRRSSSGAIETGDHDVGGKSAQEGLVSAPTAKLAEELAAVGTLLRAIQVGPIQHSPRHPIACETSRKFPGPPWRCHLRTPECCDYLIFGLCPSPS